MYSINTPISYNTNFESVLAHYQFGFCGGNCNPYASLFNKYSTFNQVAYQFPSLYPTMCPDSYNLGSVPPQPASNTSVNLMPFFSSGFSNSSAPQSPHLLITLPSGIGLGGTGFSTNPFAASSQTPVFSQINNPSFTSTQTSLQTTSTPSVQTNNNYSAISHTDLRKNFVSTARKYSNCGEYNGSQHKFCINDNCKSEDPFDQEWCTDFVTYVVKETYRNNGKVVPAGFGNHDVRTLKNWAINNNYFLRTSNKPRKGAFIAKNVSPGDIIILNENGASHTGFVTKVDKDGTVHTIEGNRDDRVEDFAYSPNYPDISGFIRLTS